jgi:hypothetical protein
MIGTNIPARHGIKLGVPLVRRSKTPRRLAESCNYVASSPSNKHVTFFNSRDRDMFRKLPGS